MSSSLGRIIQIASGLAAIAVYGYARWRDPRRRARRALRDLIETPISAIEDGERVRVTGVVSARGETVIAPISRRPCIGYRVVVKGKPIGVRSELEDVLVREDCKEFWIDDGSGRALVERPVVIGVDADDAAWSGLPPTVYQLLEDAKVPLTGALGGDREFSYTEARLDVDDSVSVVGRASCTLDPAGQARGHRKLPTLVRITGTKAEPVMVADADEPPP